MEIHRADDRFRTASEWLDSRHSFSFGPHYDPANVGFGFLLAHNDDTVAPGTGFDTHPHQDLEIVTWVLRGALAHRDSQGNSGEVHPGLAQRMTAGSGIQHSEWNDGPDPVHYVQMWVRPDRLDLPPSYEQTELDLTTGELVPVASGLAKHAASTAIRLNQPPPVCRSLAWPRAARSPCPRRRTCISSSRPVRRTSKAPSSVPQTPYG